MITGFSAIAELRRRAHRAREDSTCGICNEEVGAEHRHVVDIVARRLFCACTACWMTIDGTTHATLRSVPARSEIVEVEIAADDLAALGVPVGLAFFFYSSRLEQWTVGFPSPAGATEAELSDGAWDAFLSRGRLPRRIRQDVEGFLVRADRGVTPRGFVVPIDVCYDLVGLLRRRWRGLDGGDEARAAIADFFDSLPRRQRSSVRTA